MKKYNRMPLIVTSTGYYSFTPQIPGKSKHSMNKNQGPNIEIPSQQIIQPQGPGPQIPNQEIPQPQGPGPVIIPNPQGPGPVIQPNPQGPGPVIIPQPQEPGPVIYPSNQSNEKKLKVYIKSVYNQKRVISGYKGYLYAVGEDLGSKFELIIFKNNTAKIKVIDGEFIRIDEKGFLVADTNKENASIFTLININKSEYIIQALNKKFVRVRRRDNALIANSIYSGESTIFKFIKI